MPWCSLDVFVLIRLVDDELPAPAVAIYIYIWMMTCHDANRVEVHPSSSVEKGVGRLSKNSSLPSSHLANGP